jgi:FAD/FMN-containing dehydrogenase/Fe-S oxidoreductase
MNGVIMQDLPSEKLTEFWADLHRHVGGDIKTDAYSRALYSTDSSIYQVMPYGVFFPGQADQIQGAVEVAARHGVPVLMRGAGSSLAGQCVNKALVVDVSRYMTQVIEVNAEEKWARVQPGLVLDAMNEHLRPMGLQFGPDPASSNRATLGGIVGNNSTGAHSIVYGMAADHVLGAKVILSDGTPANFGPLTLDQLDYYREREGFEGHIYRGMVDLLGRNEEAIRSGTPKHWRRCGGYNLDRLIGDEAFNLARLICGAEGTLAAVTELKMNLVDRPKVTGLGIIHFDELPVALESVPQVLETDPSAVELMDNLGLTLCREVPAYARLLTFLEGDPNSILITEYTGDSEAEVKGKLDKLEAFLAQRGIGVACVRAETAAQQSNVWNVRKVGLGLLMSIKGDHKPIPFIEDSAVLVEYLAEYIAQIESFCNDLGVRVAYYAHASAGCLHVRPLINLKEAEEARKMVTIAERAAELVAGYNGALSSEHGDGRARSWLNERFFGPDLYRVYQEAKQTFDPENILNPGNIVNAGPMTENLRFGETYSTISVNEHIDFSSDIGFHRAVEMCNGAGVCRKDTGTMCPSYMVTRDEEHSTRGRANLLRAALSGALPREELTSARMYEAMDLCIECKACKAECPSSVDMAKIKFEFLANYYETKPVPFQVRFFANIALFNRLGSMMAPLANWSLKNKLFRWVLEKAAGIDSRRSLPEFAAIPFTRWFNNRFAPQFGENQKTVVLFNDTFNTYNYPHVAIAATEVLEAAGYRVVLPGHWCCGRPMISKGLVDQARAAAAATVAKLAPFAKAGIPVIGLEPSCLSALIDDYLALLPDNEDAKAVAQVAVTFEEFVAKLADDPDAALPLSPQATHILLHGHCHQKALIGTAAVKKALGMLGEETHVTEVDSGCCGMAGAFGYETEHYDVSMAMAERKLLPAVRATGDRGLVVAAGVSCRQQIKHGSGKQALHPAEVIHRALNGS